MSDRLDQLIQDPAERTYLAAIDGYWADRVLAEFAFLEERGGRLAEIRFHQNGDYIVYTGPWGTITLELLPDRLSMGARASLRGATSSFEGELDRLSRDRQPLVRMPPTLPFERPTIASNVRHWAELLRSSSDLF